MFSRGKHFTAIVRIIEIGVLSYHFKPNLQWHYFRFQVSYYVVKFACFEQYHLKGYSIYHSIAKY